MLILDAAWIRLSCAPKVDDIPMPAESEEELDIFEPVESPFKDLPKAVSDLPRIRAALSATTLVLFII
tara:strand:- start:132 stop:335 length:204 start_codon:yes stop_codon:yes gene_type:complete